MKKRAIAMAFVFTACFITSSAAETVSVSHFLSMPSYNGASGFIAVPSANTTPENTFTLGLHRFVFKANYGLFGLAEIGLNADFTNTSDFLLVLKNAALNAKAVLLREEDFFISAAAGIDKLPINVFESMTGRDFGGYIIVSKTFGDMAFSAGIKKYFTGYAQENTFVADISKVVADTVLAVVEYETGSVNAGLKISMNSNISVDLFLSGLEKSGNSGSLGAFLKDNFIFGITYTQ